MSSDCVFVERRHVGGSGRVACAGTGVAGGLDTRARNTTGRSRPIVGRSLSGAAVSGIDRV